MFDIALYEPEIAPNTGNIIRLCANCGANLHLIEPLGFDLEEKKLRRAGLDYHDLAHVHRHANFEAFLAHIGRIAGFLPVPPRRPTSTPMPSSKKGDVLLFGPETRGLPSDLIDSLPLEQRLRIPMHPDSRSLNLSNAAAIIGYEAWRQFGFKGAV